MSKTCISLCSSIADFRQYNPPLMAVLYDTGNYVFYALQGPNIGELNQSPVEEFGFL
ncbi:hypothetical protein PN836_004185 [Ningiella sp. W23]|uniref:hypothetical protein n=1 Tax=Ningiella sp. W23 TaxID=3023715 RepID=UPI00375815FD